MPVTHQHQAGWSTPATAATAPARPTWWTTAGSATREAGVQAGPPLGRQARRGAVSALWSAGLGSCWLPSPSWRLIRRWR
jgi:hypothetical protein